MRTIVALFLLAVLVPLASPFASSPEHSTAWVLVRLKSPLHGKRVDGSFPLSTGMQELDRAIQRTGVHFIEPALPVSMKQPKNLRALQATGLDRTYRFHVESGRDLVATIEELSLLPEVDYAEPDYIGRGGGVLMPNDTSFGSQYGYQQVTDADVDGPEAWAIETGSEEIVIAVLDTGADLTHEDLRLKLVDGFDFVNVDSDPTDDHGHGSNVGSIAAATTNNSRGIAGACWGCRLMPIKVLDSNNSGFYSWWVDGMVWATDNGADIINISAGGFGASATLLSGVQYAYNAGVIDVSITHNDDSNLVRYPGFYGQTIAVGGTDDLDRRADPFCYSAASGSNYGPQIDVVGPGELILGVANGGGYDFWCGTSQAAPLVAGLVGLMKSIYPSLGREQARHLIRSAADDQVGRPAEDTAGFDQHHGWGRVNMERTLLGTTASMALEVNGAAATRVTYSTRNPLATSYDFIRGDLSSLNEGPVSMTVGDVVCLENDSPDPDTFGNEDVSTPSVGNGYFYLGRINAAPGRGSYGGTSRNRDRDVISGDCAP